MKYVPTFEEFINEKYNITDKYLIESNKSNKKEKKLRKELEQWRESLKTISELIKKAKDSGDKDELKHLRNQKKKNSERILKIRAELGHKDALDKLGLTGDKNNDKKIESEKNIKKWEEIIKSAQDKISKEKAKGKNANQGLIDGTQSQIDYLKQRISHEKSGKDSSAIDDAENKLKFLKDKYKKAQSKLKTRKEAGWFSKEEMAETEKEVEKARQKVEDAEKKLSKLKG